MASDFATFATAGRELAELHTGYETCEEHKLDIQFTDLDNAGTPQPHHYRLTEKAMKFAGKRGNPDRSTLIVNDHITLTGIPDSAHEYEVNGRSPLGWFIDRYKITTDKKSGIVNDPNEWFDKPEDLIAAIRRIVYLSDRTVNIVKSLPPSI